MHQFSIQLLLQIILLSFVRSDPKILLRANDGVKDVHGIGVIQSVNGNIWEVLVNRTQVFKATDTKEKVNIAGTDCSCWLTFNFVEFQFIDGIIHETLYEFRRKGDWLRGSATPNVNTSAGNVLLSINMGGSISLAKVPKSSDAVYQGFQTNTNLLVLTLQSIELNTFIELFQDTISPMVEMTVFNQSSTKSVMIQTEGQKIHTIFFNVVFFRYWEVSIQNNKITFSTGQEKGSLIIKNCYLKSFCETMHFIGKVYYYPDNISGIIWIQEMRDNTTNKYINAAEGDQMILQSIQEIYITIRHSESAKDPSQITKKMWTLVQTTNYTLDPVAKQVTVTLGFGDERYLRCEMGNSPVAEVKEVLVFRNIRGGILTLVENDLTTFQSFLQHQKECKNKLQALFTTTELTMELLKFKDNEASPGNDSNSLQHGEAIVIKYPKKMHSALHEMFECRFHQYVYHVAVQK